MPHLTLNTFIKYDTQKVAKFAGVDKLLCLVLTFACVLLTSCHEGLHIMFIACACVISVFLSMQLRCTPSMPIATFRNSRFSSSYVYACADTFLGPTIYSSYQHPAQVLQRFVREYKSCPYQPHLKLNPRRLSLFRPPTSIITNQTHLFVPQLQCSRRNLECS